MEIEANNRLFLARVAAFLNDCPDAIDRAAVWNAASDIGCTPDEAYRILLAGALDVYDDAPLRERWLRPSLEKRSAEDYAENPYRRLIRFPTVTDGEWSLRWMRYQPYELFVSGDMKAQPDGRVLPQLGYFSEEFAYPAALQGGRIWMTVTPNEIETMQRPIAQAHGDVCAYGLGLGYFAFMASEKESVRSVTVVERDASAIRLFETHLLPQFPHASKLSIVQGDALQYANGANQHDFVFADLWHDVSDGLPLWDALRPLEKRGTEYAYWIEDTMRLYR